MTLIGSLDRMSSRSIEVVVEGKLESRRLQLYAIATNEMKRQSSVETNYRFIGTRERQHLQPWQHLLSRYPSFAPRWAW